MQTKIGTTTITLVHESKEVKAFTIELKGGLQDHIEIRGNIDNQTAWEIAALQAISLREGGLNSEYGFYAAQMAFGAVAEVWRLSSHRYGTQKSD